MTDYVPGAGDVEIELNGNTEWLKPSLAAALLISGSEWGDPRSLADRVLGLNIYAIRYVIAAGTGRKPDDALLADVYATGTVVIFGKCLRFLHIIANGGREPKEDENKPGDPPLSS